MRLLVLTAVLGLAGAPSALAQAACGPTTEVRPGDTLSAIARRCDLSEGRILALNPALDGSDDLIVGDRLTLTAGGEAAAEPDTLGRLGAIAGDAARSLAGSAREAGKALGAEVDQFLDDNPGIGRRVRDLTGGGTDGAAPARVTRRSGTDGGVALTATGLPAEKPVIVTGGPPGEAQRRLADGRTDAAGGFTALLPASADIGPDWRLTVRAADGGWKAVAEPGAI